MQRAVIAALCVAVVALTLQVSAYSNGAGSCNFPDSGMTNNAAQSATDGFSITMKELVHNTFVSSYVPNAEYEIVGSRAANFIGFLMQAVSGTPPGIKGSNLVGTFTPSSSRSQKACGSCSPASASITHSAPYTSGSVIGAWKAPATDVGPITFHVTYVQDQNTWWGDNTAGRTKTVTFSPIQCNGTLVVPIASSLQATAATNSSVTLVWTVPACTGQNPITSYLLQFDDGTGAGFLTAYSGTALTATVVGLNNSALAPIVTFRLRAVTNSGPGEPAFTTARPLPDNAQVPAGVSVVATALSGTVVNLVWSPPNLFGIQLVSYTLQFGPTSGGAPFPTVYTGTDLAYNATGLTGNTQYSAVVIARSLAGAGPAAAPVTVTTPNSNGCPTCAGHGSCDASQTCICNAGWIGTSCETQAFTAELGGDITVSYKIVGSLLYLQFVYPGTGYVGFGLNGSPITGMDGMDALVITATAPSVASTTCTRYYATTQTTPDVFPDNAGFCNVLSVTGSTSGTMRVLVTRPLAGGSNNQAQSYTVGADKLVQISWSRGGDYSFTKHTVRGKAQINFVSGASVDVAQYDFAGVGIIGFISFIIALLILVLCSLCCMHVSGVRQSSLGRWLNYSFLANRKANPALWYHQISYNIVPAIQGMTFGEFATVLLYGIAWIPALILAKPLYDDSQRDFTNMLGTATAYAVAGALVLPTRNSLWVKLIGTPYERIIKFHRWIGRAAVGLMTAHGAVQVVSLGWDVVLSSEMNGNIGAGNVYGIIAWFLFVVPFILTDETVRRQSFEVFLYSHMLMLGGVIVAMIHSSRFLAFGIAPFALWFIDQAIRTLRPYIRPAKVITATPLPSGNGRSAGITKLVIEIPGFRYESGQYVFVNFPSISMMQWHPFSISSAPGGANPDQFTLHIMNMGPNTFTHQVAAAANELQSGSAQVRVDGPYGRLSIPLVPAPESQIDELYKTAILVAGGVGVTPMMSVFLDLYRRAKAGANGAGPWASLKTVNLVWICGNREAFDSWYSAELAEVTAAPTVGGITFVVHAYATESKKVGYGAATDSKDQKESVPLDVKGGAPPPAGAGALPNVKNGRPAAFGQLFAECINAAGVKYASQVAVLACGPEPMVNNVHQESDSAGYHLHTETFFL